MTRQNVTRQNVTRQNVTRQIVTRQNVAEPKNSISFKVNSVSEVSSFVLTYKVLFSSDVPRYKSDLRIQLQNNILELSELKPRKLTIVFILLIR